MLNEGRADRGLKILDADENLPALPADLVNSDPANLLYCAYQVLGNMAVHYIFKINSVPGNTYLFVERLSGTHFRIGLLSKKGTEFQTVRVNGKSEFIEMTSNQGVALAAYNIHTPLQNGTFYDEQGLKIIDSENQQFLSLNYEKPSGLENPGGWRSSLIRRNPTPPSPKNFWGPEFAKMSPFLRKVAILEEGIRLRGFYKSKLLVKSLAVGLLMTKWLPPSRRFMAKLAAASFPSHLQSRPRVDLELVELAAAGNPRALAMIESALVPTASMGIGRKFTPVSSSVQSDEFLVRFLNPGDNIVNKMKDTPKDKTGIVFMNSEVQRNNRLQSEYPNIEFVVVPEAAANLNLHALQDFYLASRSGQPWQDPSHFALFVGDKVSPAVRTRIGELLTDLQTNNKSVSKVVEWEIESRVILLNFETIDDLERLVSPEMQALIEHLQMTQA